MNKVDRRVALDRLTVIIDSGATVPPINAQYVVPLVANLENSIATRQCYLTLRNLRKLLLSDLIDFDSILRNHLLQLYVVRSFATLGTSEYCRSFSKMR